MKMSTYRTTAIRTSYSQHCMRATLEGFAPLSLYAFVRVTAHACFIGA